MNPTKADANQEVFKVRMQKEKTLISAANAIKEVRK